MRLTTDIAQKGQPAASSNRTVHMGLKKEVPARQNLTGTTAHIVKDIRLSPNCMANKKGPPEGGPHKTRD